MAKFAVYCGLHVDSRPRIDLIGDNWPHGAKRVKAFGAGPLSVFVLQVTSRDIIHTGVAEDAGTDIVTLFELVGCLADHNP